MRLTSKRIARVAAHERGAQGLNGKLVLWRLSPEDHQPRDLSGRRQTRSRWNDRARLTPWSTIGNGHMAPATRFPIRFEPAYAALSRMFFISPADSYIEIVDGDVSVRMGWAFRATFDRSAVQGTSVSGKRVLLTRGVHGWAGRWLVNDAGDGILSIRLEPRQRGYVMGFSVTLRDLLVSVDAPSALAGALNA
jgi:hypothetical protein